MLKCIAILAVFIAVLAVEAMPAQQKRPDKAQQGQSNQPLPTINETNNCVPNRQNQNVGDGAREWQKFVTWPESWTAWAIIVTLGAITWQASLMRIHARHLSGLVVAAADNAVAAKESAKATLELTKVMIEKERARLSVIFPDESDTMTVSPDKPEIGSFRLNLKNTGGTLAYNITAAYDAFGSEAESIPFSDDMFHVGVPAFVEGGTWGQTDPLTIDPKFSGGSAPAVFYVYLRTRVTYNDLFKKTPNVTTAISRRKFGRTRPGEAVSNEFWESVSDPSDSENTLQS